MPVRDSRLVCEHLENIGRDSLQDYPKIIGSFARGRHGVYALYRGSKLYYVGLATNLRQRLDRHLRDRHRGTWDRFSLYLTVDDRHLHEIEALFLRISKPSGNRARPRLRSDNLKGELSRRIKEQQRQQRIDILGGTSGARREVPPARETIRGGRARPTALARCVKKRREIRLVHQGRTHLATVQKDGTIDYRGETFPSPSGAARAIVGVTVNGWRVWQYERRGKWVPLSSLRGRSTGTA